MTLSTSCRSTEHNCAVERQHQLIGDGVEQQRGAEEEGRSSGPGSYSTALHGLASEEVGGDRGKVKSCKGVAAALAELDRLVLKPA